MRLKATLALGCLSLMGAIGCQSPSPSQPSDSISRTDGGPRVELMNLTARTGSTNTDDSGTERFFQHAAGLYAAGKFGSLERLVKRFPDCALEVLRGATPETAQDELLPALAEAYDRCFIVDAQSIGWLNWISALRRRNATVASVAQRRATVCRIIEQGRFHLATQTAFDNPPSRAAFLIADCLRLRGIAHFLANKPAAATDDWLQALDYANADPCVSAELELLVSVTKRRNGRVREAEVAWSTGASRAVHCPDPNFWGRLIESRPPDAHWPEQVEFAFSRANGTSEPESRFGDGAVWYRIANWRLERNEPEAALLAFTQAQQHVVGPRAIDDVRIGQARCLLALNRTGPALNILTKTAGSSDKHVAYQAQSILGVVDLQRGRVGEGLHSLQRSVENKEGVRWPRFLEAQADLALAYLAAGQESTGLSRLHEIQHAFQQKREMADLCRSLTNEARYLERAGKRDLARPVRERLVRLEQSARNQCQP